LSSARVEEMNQTRAILPGLTATTMSRLSGCAAVAKKSVADFLELLHVIREAFGAGQPVAQDFVGLIEREMIQLETRGCAGRWEKKEEGEEGCRQCFHERHCSIAARRRRVPWPWNCQGARSFYFPQISLNSLRSLGIGATLAVETGDVGFAVVNVDVHAAEADAAEEEFFVPAVTGDAVDRIVAGGAEAHPILLAPELRDAPRLRAGEAPGIDDLERGWVNRLLVLRRRLEQVQLDDIGFAEVVSIGADLAPMLSPPVFGQRYRRGWRWARSPAERRGGKLW